MSNQTNTATKPSILNGQVITRAVLYARVSNIDDRNATSSIESQLKECGTYAESRGYHIVGEFFEDPNRPTSGADWLPELERALELAEANGYDVLIVRELDRLSRNLYKYLAIENRLESMGKRVESAKENFGDTEDGQLLKNLKGSMAQWELSKIKARTARGRIDAVKGGSVIVGGAKAPYGYDIEVVSDKRVLVVNEAEAATIRLIFDLYTRQGYTMNRISGYLDDRNIGRRQKGEVNKKKLTDKPLYRLSKKTNWTVTSLGRILGNETYAGRWHYRKTQRVKNPKTGKYKQIPRPRSEWLQIAVPPIVSEETFAEAQRLRGVNKHIRENNSTRTYFLGGMIKCAHCGRAVFGITTTGDKKYRYYKCASLHTPTRFETKCTESKSHRQHKIDAAVWQWLKSILLDTVTLQRSLDEYQEAQEDVHNPILRMIEASEKKLIDLEDKLARLIDAYSAGVLSLNDLAKSKAALDKQITDTRQTIEALQADLAPEALTEGDIESIHAFAAAFRENVDLIDADLSARREIAKLLQVKVILARDYVDISCVLGATTSRVPFVKPCEDCYNAVL